MFSEGKIVILSDNIKYIVVKALYGENVNYYYVYKLVEDEKIAMGKVIKVENQMKVATANDVYLSVQVEDESGDNERCLLFTEKEFDKVATVKADFMIESMKAGRIYNAIIDGDTTYLVKVGRGDIEKIIRLSPSQLEIAENRSEKNPEDLTKKSLLTDMID